LDSWRPAPKRGLTTAKTVAKLSVVSDTAGKEERGAPIHRH
jgi:hypothetical protein